MSVSLIPDYMFQSLFEITPEFLHSLGVNFLMLDLDNTIAKYSEAEPSEEMTAWVEGHRRAGMRLHLVSNNRSEKRVSAFASALGIGYVTRAGKPSIAGLERAMKKEGRLRIESALAGDQLFTDVLAANRAGIISICVEPISLKNPLHALRYAAERPLRAHYRKKNRE